MGICFFPEHSFFVWAPGPTYPLRCKKKKAAQVCKAFARMHLFPPSTLKRLVWETVAF